MNEGERVAFLSMERQLEQPADTSRDRIARAHIASPRGSDPRSRMRRLGPIVIRGLTLRLRSMVTAAAIVLWGPVLWDSGAACAQLVPGDWIVGTANGSIPRLLRIDANDGVSTLAVSLTSGMIHRAVLPTRDNRAALLLNSRPDLAQSNILRLDAAGRASTVGVFPDGLVDAYWASDGRIVYSTGRQQLFAFDPRLNQRSTIATLSQIATATGVTAGQADSSFVATNIGILEVGFGGTVRTLFRQQNPTAIRYDYGSGSLLAIVPGGSASSLLSIDPMSGMATTLSFRPPIAIQDVRITEARTIGVVGGPTPQFQEIDLTTGAVLRTIPLGGAAFQPRCLERFGSNRLHLSLNRIQRLITFEMNDPSMANNAYVLLLSMASSPGIKVTATKYLALQPDPLLLAGLNGSLGSLGFTNDVGVFDPTGSGVAYLRNRLLPPTPVNLYAAWVSLGRTSILTVSETEVFLLP